MEEKVLGTIPVNPTYGREEVKDMMCAEESRLKKEVGAELLFLVIPSLGSKEAKSGVITISDYNDQKFRKIKADIQHICDTLGRYEKCG